MIGLMEWWRLIWQGLFRKAGLVKVRVNNPKLGVRLEAICQRKKGVITYGEYFLEEQYGVEGYHMYHRMHGKTDAHRRWAEGILNLAAKEKMNNIVEFGSGDGSLGAELLTLSKEKKQNIIWTGVEISQELRSYAKENLEKAGIRKGFRIGEKLEKQKGKSLVVFSFGLDSLQAEILIGSRDYPREMVGVEAKKGRLKEVILMAKDLKARGMSLEEGLLKTGLELVLDLRSWNLWPGQRVYFPLGALETVWEYSQKVPAGSLFLFIDEFRFQEPWWEARPLGLPKDLYHFSRDCRDIKKYYREAGEHLLYFPLYLEMFLGFLREVGFKEISYDSEKRMAARLVGVKDNSFWGASRTFAVVGKSGKGKEEVFLSSPKSDFKRENFL